MPACPLCLDERPGDFAHAGGRHYFRCGTCALVFLDPRQLPGREEERAEYDTHENDPDDPRYRRHLARLTDRLVQGLLQGAAGLDYGSGPGPAIRPMLAAMGYDVTDYDPFFAPDRGALSRRYDFIACTETAEHFHKPGDEFRRLANLVKPGGRLGIMTQLLLPGIDFPNWRYRREKSHVVFYAPKTMELIAARHNWTVEIIPPDIVLFEAGHQAEPHAGS